MSRKKSAMLWQMFLTKLAVPVLDESSAKRMGEAVRSVLRILTDSEDEEVEEDPVIERTKDLVLMENAGLRPIRIVK